MMKIVDYFYFFLNKWKVDYFEFEEPQKRKSIKKKKMKLFIFSLLFSCYLFFFKKMLIK